MFRSAQPAFGGVRRLTDQMAVVDGGGSNVLAFFTGEGFVLVDGGAPKSFDKIMSLGANAKVNTLFNTHHHVDQTGNNEMFSTGTKITLRTSAPWSGCRPTTGFRLTIAMKEPARRPPVPRRRFSPTVR